MDRFIKYIPNLPALLPEAIVFVLCAIGAGVLIVAECAA